jgi:hypothetical protein
MQQKSSTRTFLKLQQLQHFEVGKRIANIVTSISDTFATIDVSFPTLTLETIGIHFCVLPGETARIRNSNYLQHPNVVSFSTNKGSRARRPQTCDCRSPNFTFLKIKFRPPIWMLWKFTPGLLCPLSIT